MDRPMKPTRLRSAFRHVCLATGLLLPMICVDVLSVVPTHAQELVAPGQATPETNPRPTVLGGNTAKLPAPSFAMDDLPDNPPVDEDELLEVNSLRNYRQRLEEHNLRAEQAKLEARARFESRSRDLIPGLPSNAAPAEPTAPRNNALPESIPTPAPAKPSTPPPVPPALTPPASPPRTVKPSVNQKTAEQEKLLELPPPLRPRQPQTDRTTPARPQRLGGNAPATNNQELPEFRPVPNRERSQTPKSSEQSKRLNALKDEDTAVESASDLEAPRTPPAPKARSTQSTRPTTPPAKRADDTEPPRLEADPKKPADDPSATRSRSVIDTETMDSRQHSTNSNRSGSASSQNMGTPTWPDLMQDEVTRWPLPASFASHGGGPLSGHPSSVTCSTCGGCVDRSGVGVERLSKTLGVCTGTRPACQCWRCPQSMPFNLYGPGNYVGPARSAPMHEYRLRGGDQVQLTFLIKTVRSVGAYRLVVGDELLIESEADEKLTRGTLERGLEIQPDGTITLRFIGQIHAAGQTIDQLRELLNERYEEYYPDPSIDVTPVATGNIARQIREAISGSEGFNPQQTVQTITPEGTLRLPRLGAVPAQGLTLSELKREIILRYDSMSAGLDVEVVLEQQAPHYVYVLGEVTTPGRFEIDAPTTVLGGIALGGGYVPGANLRQVVIFRRGPNWELLSTMLDLRGAIMGKDSRPIDEIWLQDGDVVIIPPSPIRLFDRFVSQVFTEGVYGIVPFSGFGFSFGDGN
ncbi:polysaccharide biosynthesis/export family protein [Rhodopirellula baltica]|uniref:Polysaccharide biosynthesis/export protein n=1 Tax=Rhodopirellula baltica WH47 TaxID=991778 RepID=F2AS11_RHOBT|nr:polysaccharide biosynthesis/export family protein [Rhodopirellula baltica]EGF27506.1 polysaccharide biosynthesis/export protein [Rhodopirellula baltica WH47]